MNKKDKYLLVIILIFSTILLYLFFFNSIANQVSNAIPIMSSIQGYFIGMIIPDTIFIKFFWNEGLNRGVNRLKGRGNIVSTGKIFIGFIIISFIGYIINTYYLQNIITEFNINLFERTYLGVIFYFFYMTFLTLVMVIFCLAFVFVNNGIKFPKFSGLNFPTHL